jgi:hypothetical protein
MEEPKDWCELTDGKDFYEYDKHVDWIISNPPFTKFSGWLKHSIKIADNIVYLIPMQKVFYTYSMIKELYEWGGVKEMWMIGTGSSLGFPFGAGVAAIYFKRGYNGGINITFR